MILSHSVGVFCELPTSYQVQGWGAEGLGPVQVIDWNACEGMWCSKTAVPGKSSCRLQILTNITALSLSCCLLAHANCDQRQPRFAEHAGLSCQMKNKNDSMTQSLCKSNCEQCHSIYTVHAIPARSQFTVWFLCTHVSFAGSHVHPGHFQGGRVSNESCCWNENILQVIAILPVLTKMAQEDGLYDALTLIVFEPWSVLHRDMVIIYSWRFDDLMFADDCHNSCPKAMLVSLMDVSGKWWLYLWLNTCVCQGAMPESILQYLINFDLHC